MKLKIEHLAPYAPYKLKLINGVVRVDLTAISLDSPFVFITTYLGSREEIMKHIDEVKPILRPLSDLTKEIEVNGEKFVPMVELAKIANLDITKYSLGEYNGDTYGILCDIKNDDDIDTHEVLGFDLISGFGHHYKPSKNFTIVNNQLQLWNKLFEWHFDIFGLIQNNLAIDLNSLNK